MNAFEFIDNDLNTFVFNVFYINECITVSIKFNMNLFLLFQTFRLGEAILTLNYFYFFNPFRS